VAGARLAVGGLVELIEQRIERYTHDWFPDQPHSRVEVRVLADRPTCVLLTVHLDGADVPAALAKLRRDSGVVADAGSRPRLREEAASAEERTLVEWAGLQAIHRACGDSAGLGVVRPLLLMREEAALVMSFVDAPTLRSTLLDLSRLRLATGRLDEAVLGCRLAGRWLREFQHHQGDLDLPVRQGTREEVAGKIIALGDFFGSAAWRELAAAGAEVATGTLPRRLPVAVGHGDFAPRNMLLGGGVLTVIDPLPRWRVPVYDDLSRFLVGTRMLGEQVHTQGLAFGSETLDALEEAAVAAYLGTAERAPLRAYQLLILMDKWSAMRRNPRRDLPGRLARWSAALADHRIRAEAARLVDLAAAHY
jgi:hypothetical protein